MRRAPISQAVAEEEEINITPMLDVVFILLIFFIVTANFIKEPGLEVAPILKLTWFTTLPAGEVNGPIVLRCPSEVSSTDPQLSCCCHQQT